MKHVFTTFFLALGLALVPASFLAGGSLELKANTTLAAIAPEPGGGSSTGAPADSKSSSSECESAGGVYLSVPISGSNHCLTGDKAKGGVIVAYLRQILIFLGGIIGSLVLLMMLISGIQYIVSVGQPEKVASAKKRITNAFKALFLFILAYAILGFVIPGGII